MSNKWWLAALVTYAFVSLSLVRCTAPQEATPPTLRQKVLREGGALTTTTDGGTSGPTMLPEAPLPWQQTPPCGVGEHVINGACYMRWHPEDMSPPCARDSVEWKKRCYRPIAKPRPGVSGE